MSNSAPKLSPEAVHYRQHHWVHLRLFISPASLPGYLDNVLAARSERVTVGARSEWWMQHAIEPRSPLGAFLCSSSIFELAQAALGVPLRRNPDIWAQVYQAGERISSHRDAAGVIQFLACLQSPNQDCGGAFCMRVADSPVQIKLQAGDAFLFKATEIPHSTTRLMASPQDPRPRRVTAVARFFAAQSLPSAFSAALGPVYTEGLP